MKGLEEGDRKKRSGVEVWEGGMGKLCEGVGKVERSGRLCEEVGVRWEEWKGRVRGWGEVERVERLCEKFGRKWEGWKGRVRGWRVEEWKGMERYFEEIGEGGKVGKAM